MDKISIPLITLTKTLFLLGLTETQKQEKRQQHAIKETEFLRLKRSRLGVEDFEPLKGKTFTKTIYLSCHPIF